ncbi:MAG: hypothetical protein RQ732_09850 [Methylophaga sp.]|nr:hypothetical protein [Methylophaga sp.]
MDEQMTEEQMMQQQDPAMQQADPAAQQPQPEQQGVSPDDMRNAMAGEGEANANPDETKMQEIHERFVLNVIRLASKDEYEYDKIVALMNSADDPAQGFGRALFFILEAVKEGLENKGVEIPGQLWLAENGIIEQSAKAIAMLGVNAGVKLDQDAVTTGIELASEAIAETDDVRKQQQQMGPEDMPQQQPGPAMQQTDPGMQPNPDMQQASQQPQGGLLSQAGGM